MQRRWLILPVGLAIALLAAVWATGGLDLIAARAAESQQAVQGAMARSLRALKAGEPGATATLLGIAFAYGFFHAVGPGHGKVLIGGYGLGRRVPVGRLVALALVSSLAQAATAILLVYAGVLLFHWTRERTTEIADRLLEPLSYALIGMIGLWLLWRGLRGLARRLAPPDPAIAARPGSGPPDHGLHDHRPHDHHDHDHRTHGSHAGGAACDACGHAHGPSLAEAAEVRSLRDALLLIGGVAVRPCTGAIFLLLLTWRLGVVSAGIAGVVAMALGTATVTIAVALASVSLREGTLLAAADSPAVRLVVPALELAAGGLVALVAATLLLHSL